MRAHDLDGTRAQVLVFALQWREEGFSHWAVEELASGRLIGRIGLLRHHDWPESDSPVEVGWVLHPDRWGRGLATEGGCAAMRAWLDHLPDDELISITGPRNRRSRAVMERLGLSFRGETRWHGSAVVWYGIGRAEARAIIG
jgi:RimJ/RimL family protein N-acetyltransferase